MQGVGVSIARGTGRQTLGAAIIFVSYYIFALPIGVPLMFATDLGLAGNVHLNYCYFCTRLTTSLPGQAG